uniref:Uncharacterized protein n=1 Tax=viral metagenome TaxID=1070528 RepID=A0A6M3IGA4_9ZZZZ
MKNYFKSILDLSARMAELAVEVRLMRQANLEQFRALTRVYEVLSETLEATKTHSNKLTEYLLFDQRSKIESKMKKEEEEQARGGTKYDGLF